MLIPSWIARRTIVYHSLAVWPYQSHTQAVIPNDVLCKDHMHHTKASTNCFTVLEFKRRRFRDILIYFLQGMYYINRLDVNFREEIRVPTQIAVPVRALKHRSFYVVFTIHGYFKTSAGVIEYRACSRNFQILFSRSFGAKSISKSKILYRDGICGWL